MYGALKDVSLTWLGNTTFLVHFGNGNTLLVDSWVNQNPSCPDEYKQFDRLDLILITNSRDTRSGDAVTLAKRFSSSIVTTYEFGSWLQEHGVVTVTGMDRGGRIDVLGLEISMVAADNGASIKLPVGTKEGFKPCDDVTADGGGACGYVVKFPGGGVIYFAGETNIFGDMALIRDIYRPDVAVLPIGGRFGMGPELAARAVELLGVEQVIPMAYGWSASVTGTPERFEQECAKRGLNAQIYSIQPGERI